MTAGHPLSLDHLAEALREIVKAQRRLDNRVPDHLFPQELKDRYIKNLSEAGTMVQGWIDQAEDDRPPDI